jgi:hypothetical protein
LVFFSLMGTALWVSFNMSIWYNAVNFRCFSDCTIMIACLPRPSWCCIAFCQTDNAVQLVFVHCATRLVFIGRHRRNMFQAY